LAKCIIKVTSRTLAAAFSRLYAWWRLNEAEAVHSGVQSDEHQSVDRRAPLLRRSAQCSTTRRRRSDRLEIARFEANPRSSIGRDQPVFRARHRAMAAQVRQYRRMPDRAFESVVVGVGLDDRPTKWLRAASARALVVTIAAVDSGLIGRGTKGGSAVENDAMA
jgi:hypothetical protein